MGIFNLFGSAEKADPDSAVLTQLKKAGSDLSKPHDIDFFLYFPKEAAAKEAAKDIEANVDTVKVELGPDKQNWLCFGNKRMVPDHDKLVALRKRFNEVARKGNGLYDGWGTEVVK